MQLPYSLEVYVASMAAYNAAWLPVVLLAGLLAVPACAVAFYPAGRMGNWGSRFVAGYLAAAWIWVGAAHQFGMMAGLNFMAPVYGAAWLGQGILLAWTGLYLGRLRFAFGRGLPAALAMTLILFGLLLYPLGWLAVGHDWRALPVVGTAPDPTAIVTVALLSAAGNRPPLWLFPVPLAWAGVSGVTAYMLEHPADYGVSMAIVIAFALALYRRLKRPAASTP